MIWLNSRSNAKFCSCWAAANLPAQCNGQEQISEPLGNCTFSMKATASHTVSKLRFQVLFESQSETQAYPPFSMLASGPANSQVRASSPLCLRIFLKARICGSLGT